MTWWAVGSTVASAAIGLYSANEAQNAASAASDAQIKLQRDQYNQARTDNMPALNARNQSLSRLQDLLGISGHSGAAGYGSLGGPINPQEVQNSAGYQFGLQQGQQALNNSATARGMRNSGAALLAAQRYGNDYATTKFNNAFDLEVANRNQQVNSLQSVAGLGQTGANTIGQAGQNYANQAGNAIGAAGDTAASSALYQGRTLSNGVNSLAGWYTTQPQQSNAGYYNSGGNAYANFDLSGTNRGSGD